MKFFEELGRPDTSIAIMDGPGSSRRSRLGQHISIGRGRYVLVVGTPGSGKTAFLDTVFVLNTFLNWKKFGGPKPYIIYRSMERPEKFKLAKWLAYLTFIDKGCIFDVPTILGLSNKKRDLTPDDISLLKSYEPVLEELLEIVELIPGTASPESVYERGTNVARGLGLVVEAQQGKIKVNGQIQGELNQKEVVNGVDRFYSDMSFGRIYEGKYFFPKTDRTVYHITDHVGKVLKGSRTEREAINAHATIMGDVFRDIYGFCCFDVLQMNREIENTYRQVKTELTIKRSDIKGSSVPEENADTILGLLNPLKYDYNNYEGYRITDMNEGGDNNFRALLGIKNTYGIDDFVLGLCFYGAMGFIKELPRADEMTGYDYERVKTFNYR